MKIISLAPEVKYCGIKNKQGIQIEAGLSLREVKLKA
jgi:hypothetical protein